MKKYLTGFYQEVFNKQYIHNDDEKVLIQKNTYLLEKLGLDLGNFLFLWDSYGPYSLEVRNIVNKEMGSDSISEIINYSSFAQEIIQSIKDIIEAGKKLNQTPRDWLEIVCSLHYIKNYTVPEDDVISTLEKKKARFNNRVITSNALKIVNIIDTTGCYDASCY